jgi:hypothetical protein
MVLISSVTRSFLYRAINIITLKKIQISLMNKKKWKLDSLWFIIYIYYWILQFINNVIINKTKVLLPQV